MTLESGRWETGRTEYAPPLASDLYSVAEVLKGQVPVGLPAHQTDAVRRIAGWLEGHVSRPNPELGRSGDVCPWTRRAMALRGLFITVCDSEDPAYVSARMLSLRDRFLAFENAGACSHYRAFVTVFPRLDSHGIREFVIAMHARLKPAFLEHKLMLGEFYPGCDKPGLHNPGFRPLHAEIPLLVIRPMVEADIEFLWDRDEFAAAYLNAFGARGHERLGLLLNEGRRGLDAERSAALRRLVQRHA